MQPNPALKRLGFSNSDRVVIFHTDDIAMCQASVAAFAELWDYGIISSGAVMAVCPWFLEAAAYAAAHPEADLGVHLTLTSEWKTYRWGPVSTRNPRSGMLDGQGYFYSTSEAAQKHGEPGFVRRELQAQVEKVLAAGMQPTHIDTHMGSVAHPKFMQHYTHLSQKTGLPAMNLRLDESAWKAMGLPSLVAQAAARLSARLEASGVPLLDACTGMPLDSDEDREQIARHLLGQLPAGITHFLLHPSIDTPELRQITPDWRRRVGDYRTFLSPSLKAFIRNAGIQVIGYRALKNLMPVR